MNRGDVVLAAFPYAAGTSPVRRPTLVVQADYYNQRIANVLLASITSQLVRRGDPAHFFIDVSTPEGKHSGLNQNSLVSCINLAVLPKSAIGPKIGELSPAAMQSIDHCLKAALGL
jgi:mRNA-degrading endonuclease toxin of MazEF toxin-antitoxin module